MVIYIEREEKEGKKSPFFLPPIIPPSLFPSYGGLLNNLLRILFQKIGR